MSTDMITPIISPVGGGGGVEVEDAADPESNRDSSESSGSCCGWLAGIGEILFCLIPVPIGVALEFQTPYQRPIPYQTVVGADGDVEFLRALVFANLDSGETVPSPVMFGLAIALPFIVQIILASACRRKNLSRGEAARRTCCVYFLAIGLTQTITNLAKLYVGYLRPIFYDKCDPDEDYQGCTDEEHEQQGRLSFPSGHASLSVCGMLLLSLFLEDSFGATAYRKSRAKLPWFARIVSVLCYAPMLLAFFILLSRVHDNHHHPADVVGGALLGGSIASLVFGIWYN
eukprot:CAMPEP_0197180012 /NCGR_PEP_ID=MMETSP1423-20130617/4778_1 /TAXON_ID=476441 /ORGANISM="Pseudo-nitzschia heimii, Strain UNC1101" /LENGTH=286 /DNA_ID=CAMNT_0042630029 /DNA_START=279 /DNA_END=1139 /DNA_ORIENTATION=+